MALLKLVILLLCVALAYTAKEKRRDNGSEIVSLPIGKVRGQVAEDKSHVAFKGIRYGAYQKRFEASKLVDVLHEKDEIFDASKFGFSCPQNSRLNIVGVPESEDCLFLNIWAPLNKTDAKVMVFIHGGGYVHGSGNDISLDIQGDAFASKGIILVTLNYRLGIFGFMAHPELGLADPENPSNYGLLDQIVALKWIKQYISFFGGNSGDITVFGESAGANSIQWLLAHKDHAESLFTNAILQSSPAGSFPHELNESEHYGEGFATYQLLRCPPPNALECLRNIPFRELAISSWTRRTFSPLVTPLPYSPTRMFTPHVDYKNFPVHPSVQGINGDGKPYKIIIGTNQHEWMFFMWVMHMFVLPSDEWMHSAIEKLFSSPHFAAQNKTNLNERLEHLYPRSAYATGLDRVSAIHTDFVFYCPSRSYAQKLVSQGADVHFFIFSHDATYGNPMLKSFHAAELPFIFQKKVKIFAGLVKLFPTDFSEQEIEFSNNIVKLWSEYEKKDTLSFGDVAWKPFTETGENYLEIAISPKMLSGEEWTEKCAFWDEVIPSPQQAIVFDLMSHEPFLLKLVNEMVLDGLIFVFKNLKTVAPSIFIVIVALTLRRCTRDSKRRKFKFL